MEMIVGSTALSYFDMNRRSVGDLDIWTSNQDVYNWLKGEQGTDVHLKPESIMEMIYHPHGYCTPSQIYTIKMSHAIYDIHWNKTKLDILWLKAKGCKIIPELYEVLIEHWKEEHGTKDFLSLNQDKESFFTDNVTYIYDHDYLHDLVAYPNKPMYSNCLKDGHDVLIDKDKFFAMPFENQVRMFREEIAVIACERWVLNPQWKGDISWYRAHMLSVRKTVTTLTKGFASRFLVENLEHFVKPDFSYYKHILSTLGGK